MNWLEEQEAADKARKAERERKDLEYSLDQEAELRQRADDDRQRTKEEYRRHREETRQNEETLHERIGQLEEEQSLFMEWLKWTGNERNYRDWCAQRAEKESKS